MAQAQNESLTGPQQEIVSASPQEGIQTADPQLEAAITSMDVAGLHGGGQPEVNYIQTQQATESLQVVSVINGESSTAMPIPGEAELAVEDVTADPNAMAQGVKGSQVTTGIPAGVHVSAAARRAMERGMVLGNGITPGTVTPSGKQRLNAEIPGGYLDGQTTTTGAGEIITGADPSASETRIPPLSEMVPAATTNTTEGIKPDIQVKEKEVTGETLATPMQTRHEAVSALGKIRESGVESGAVDPKHMAAIERTIADLTAGPISAERAVLVGQEISAQAASVRGQIDTLRQQSLDAQRELAGVKGWQDSSEKSPAQARTLEAVVAQEDQLKTWQATEAEYKAKVAALEQEAVALEQLSQNVMQLTEGSGPLPAERVNMAEMGAVKNNLTDEAARSVTDAALNKEDGSVDPEAATDALAKEKDPRRVVAEGEEITDKQKEVVAKNAREAGLSIETDEGGIDLEKMLEMLEADVNAITDEATLTKRISETAQFIVGLESVSRELLAGEGSDADKLAKMAALNGIILLTTRYLLALNNRRAELRKEKEAAEAPEAMPFGLMGYFNNLDAVSKLEMQKRLKESKPTSFLAWLSFLMNMVSYKPEAQAAKS